MNASNLSYTASGKTQVNAQGKYEGRLAGNMCKCSECGHTFHGEFPYNMHRVGEYAGDGGINTRRCLSTTEMEEEGLFQDNKGLWGRKRKSHS